MLDDVEEHMGVIVPWRYVLVVNVVLQCLYTSAPSGITHWRATTIGESPISILEEHIRLIAGEGQAEVRVSVQS